MMADNPYNDGRLNVGAVGEVKSLHGKKSVREKSTVKRGNDLRAGKGKK